MPKYSILIAEFEAQKSLIIDQHNDQCKTIYFCKQIPICNGSLIINKLNDLPNPMGFYESAFGQNSTN